MHEIIESLETRMHVNEIFDKWKQMVEDEKKFKKLKGHRSQTIITLRSLIICHLNYDIFCLCETHLKDNQSIKVENYRAYVHNRSNVHTRAKKGSGGVAILVKNGIMDVYDVTVMDREVDGILGLLFSRKQGSGSFIIFSCYLPPQESPWSDATIFYSHLMYKMQEFYFISDVFICGDLNFRVGTYKDFIESVDTIKPRVVIDHEKNTYGKLLLKFLKDTNLCMLNGRLTPTQDDYTFVSTRGLSVVDYVLVPHHSVNNCHYFSDCMSDILTKLNLFDMLSESCKTPDHSVLSFAFTSGNFSQLNQQNEKMNVVNGMGFAKPL